MLRFLTRDKKLGRILIEPFLQAIVTDIVDNAAPT